MWLSRDALICWVWPQMILSLSRFMRLAVRFISDWYIWMHLYAYGLLLFVPESSLEFMGYSCNSCAYASEFSLNVLISVICWLFWLSVSGRLIDVSSMCVICLDPIVLSNQVYQQGYGWAQERPGILSSSTWTVKGLREGMHRQVWRRLPVLHWPPSSEDLDPLCNFIDFVNVNFDVILLDSFVLNYFVWFVLF